MSDKQHPPLDFLSLGINKPVLKALEAVGYESPSPIQAETIPLMLAGKDILGQAQTGTGKTAAFAVPLLCQIDLKLKQPQVLVLTPTRELAIQVAEAFQRYASGLKGFNVIPVYGGQDYGVQLKQLKRGVHVIVGTPGRLMDHIRRKTLNLEMLSCLVLDEADEMLRMGFIDDVEWVLEQTPEGIQIALFSATIPSPIRRIAKKHLQDPAEITIKVKTSTADSINQRYWVVSGLHKLDALTRILEAETFDGMLIFVRTKISTSELAEKLIARGYAATALNGDIQQKQRERTIASLKSGKLDIVVATDVAARGLDVDRISHVINYDIPHDTESYIHRIGRTGRFGRTGEAILFVSPREKRLLRTIETATRKKIDLMELPSTERINDKRIAEFTQRISDTLAKDDLEFFSQLIEQYQHEYNIPAIEIAAALAQMVQGNTPLLLKPPAKKSAMARHRNKSDDRGDSRRGNRNTTDDRDESRHGHRNTSADRSESKRVSAKYKPAGPTRPGMERYRIEVGHIHDVKPGNIVGAIANEAGLDSKYIDQITIHEEYSTVDLPDAMPKEIFKDLKKTWVVGQQLNIVRQDNVQRGSKKKRSSVKKKRGVAKDRSRDVKKKGSGRASRKSTRRKEASTGKN